METPKNLFGVNLAPRFVEDWQIEKYIKPLNSAAVVVQDEQDNALKFVEWGTPYVIFREVDENHDGHWWKDTDPVRRANELCDRIDPRLLIYEGNESDTVDWGAITRYYRPFSETIAKRGRKAVILNLHAGDIERWELQQGRLDDLLSLGDELRDHVYFGSHSGSFAHFYWGYGQQPEEFLLDPRTADPANWPQENPVLNWIPISEKQAREMTADSWIKAGSEYLMFPNPLLMDREAIAMLYCETVLKKRGPLWFDTEFTNDISGPKNPYVRADLLRHGHNGYGRHAGIQTLPELYKNFYYRSKSFARAYHDQLAVVVGRYMPKYKLARIHYCGSWQDRWSNLSFGNGHNIFGHTDVLELIAAEPFYRDAYTVPTPPETTDPDPTTPEVPPVRDVITISVPRSVKEIKIVLTD